MQMDRFAQHVLGVTKIRQGVRLASPVKQESMLSEKPRIRQGFAIGARQTGACVRVYVSMSMHDVCASRAVCVCVYLLNSKVLAE